MEPMTVRAAIQIGKPSEQVFEAIVDPDIMKNGSVRKVGGKSSNLSA